ncbi:hypothetical protein [Pseudorhodoferax soli]|jgi:hypothetical protein|uniref:Conjugative transfer region protein TrbK n=1 Tax=Pseudorhodoferax soli TaxID=545864 RepID=A0A368Y0Q0_9BURK|nr:hypothetical protein [Pseudorhodoferax soli]RCW73782.1 hypothetical protein DES41_10296 [Pseudorhodoferax soli]
MSARLLAILSVASLLAGCEIPGIYPDPKVLAREADAKATGGGCRHAKRALEDCYTLNPKAPRSAVFAGWREMDQYMRENKVEGVPAVIPSPKAETTEESVASSPPEGKAERRSARGS